jgi:uncharacterized protein
MRRALGLAALFLLAAGRLGAVGPVLEKPKSFVTDKAGVFAPERLRALNEELAAFERATSNQVVLYVDRRLPEGTTLEELANETFRSWAIGQKDKSNGVLLLVFTDDRLMRVEVGYGLEGVIPDARAKQITSDVVKPFFKKGDYAGGVEAGARALMAAARGEGNVGKGRTVAERRSPPPAWAGLTVLAAGVASFVLGLLRRRTTGRRLPGVFAGGTAAGSVASFACAALTRHPLFWGVGVFLLVATVVLVIVNLIVLLLSRMPSGSRASPSSGGARSDSTTGGSSWSSDSSSSSSSGSSDFSGGGGDSGGGGSSDSW